MNIPEKVVDRLSLYHFILDDMTDSEQYISSTKIAEFLNIDNSQVRKDLKYVRNEGICHVGYNVLELKKSIEETLGFKKPRDAFIVGAGNLGSALAKYDSFKDYGLNIIAMFDNDINKIGTKINNREVFEISKLNSLVKKFNVDIAILTVPKAYAKSVASYLSDCGIKYIWNFTPCILSVSKDTKVWNENLIGSFLQFTNNNKI